MEFQNILYEVRDRIGWVTFNRPESMNAINRQMSREIIDVCREADEDSRVRVVVFTGAGERAFSAGMDLKERAGGSTPTYLERRQQKLRPAICTHYRAVASISKPTIAAVRRGPMPTTSGGPTMTRSRCPSHSRSSDDSATAC